MDGSTQELFDDEFTREVRDAYVALRVRGVPDGEATEAILYDQRYSALMSAAHASLLWLALAVAQWQYGSVVDLVRTRALSAIDDDAWLALWAETPHAIERRRAILAAIRTDLGSPAPVAPAIEIEPTHRAEPLNEARRAKGASHLAAIRGKNPDVDFDAPPEVVVNEVARRLDELRAKGGMLTEDERHGTIVALGAMWGEQIARLPDWEWAAVADGDGHGEGNSARALVRRDRGAFVSPLLHMTWYVDDPDATGNVTVALFEAIRDGRAPRGREAGAMLSLRDYAYRLSDLRWPEQRAQLVQRAAGRDRAQPATDSAPDTPGFDSLADTSRCISSGKDPIDQRSDAPATGGPPSAPAVIKRALVLRSLLDHTITGARAETPHDHLESLRASGLWSAAEREEQAVLQTPVADLDPLQVTATSLRAESLACLLWALGRLDEIPAYDAPADPALLLTLMSSDDVAESGLRPRDEIERARTIAEIWHWRSRTRELLEEGQPFPGVPAFPVKSWDDVVRYVTPQAVKLGFIPNAIDEDFPALGRPYRHLSADDWSRLRSIAMERHLALNWLCGFAPGNQWSATPTET